jgi:hypothetical protein
MKRIKGYWGGNRHDVVLANTDQRFQEFMAGLGSLERVTIKARARHDCGYGIPIEDSGYDVRVRLSEKLGWFSKRAIADFDLRLDYKNQSQDNLFYRGALPSQVQDLAARLGYECRQTDHSFVSSDLF